MSVVKRLFKYKNPYDVDGTTRLFVDAMRENAVFQYNNCSDYRRILDEADFNPQNIKTFDDLAALPFLPTLYLKHHRLESVPQSRQLIKATSSGASGSMSNIGLDYQSLRLGLSMVLRVGRYHKLLSAKPVNHIVFWLSAY